MKTDMFSLSFENDSNQQPLKNPGLLIPNNPNLENWDTLLLYVRTFL